MLGNVKEFVMYFVMTHNNQASFAAAKYATYLEGGATSVTVALKVEGVNILTCT